MSDYWTLTPSRCTFWEWGTMLIALFTSFAASRKEPLVEMLERVHAGFIAAGFGEPLIRFSLADAPILPQANALGVRHVSSVERVLKRWPALGKFQRTDASGRGRLANIGESGAVEAVTFAVIAEIARGVPKSFPFHTASFHFSVPSFSEGPAFPPLPDAATISTLLRAGVDIGGGQPTSPGVNVLDKWWVNGRDRAMGALRIVEVEGAAKNLLPPSEPVARLYAACGKVRKTIQLPFAVGQASSLPTASPQDDALSTPAGEAMRTVARRYRAMLPELAGALPHDLSPDAPSARPQTGPRKPDLVRCFAPLGYDCRGELGSFTLRRRTGGNLTVRLNFDVGTWSDSYLGFMDVLGLIDGKGFKLTLPLPPARQARHSQVRDSEIWGQFPIGGADRWAQITENLAALVAELDRGFVPEIEAISGPSPEWFEPEHQ